MRVPSWCPSGIKIIKLCSERPLESSLISICGLIRVVSWRRPNPVNTGLQPLAIQLLPGFLEMKTSWSLVELLILKLDLALSLKNAVWNRTLPPREEERAGLMMPWAILLDTRVYTLLDSDLRIEVGCYVGLLWGLLIEHVYGALALIVVVPAAIVGWETFLELLFQGAIHKKADMRIHDVKLVTMLDVRKFS